MLEDKVVVVSGAGRGIGREFALELARQRARVVVNDLGTTVNGQPSEEQPAQQVVDEIRNSGGIAVASPESVADWDSAQRIIETALDNFGRIDGVINNAGILRDRFFFNMEPDEWRAVIDVHLNGSFYVSRSAAPHFKKQKSGAFVHIVSTSGLIGNLAQANYSAAKLGMVALSKSIAMDMQRFGVRSNCISPFAWSRMIGSIPAETEEEKARVARLKSMDPAQVAPLAAFLLSDRSDVSGQVFAVRANEIFLMGQSRPIRSVHTAQGWTAQSIAEWGMSALKGSFYPLDRSQDVFTWDPV